MTLNKMCIRDSGYDVHGRALDNAEREHAEKAFRVYTALFPLDPDAALELVSLLDEEGRGPRMKTDLIVYCLSLIHIWASELHAAMKLTALLE